VINCDPGIRNAHINIVNLLGQVIHSEKITSREIRISREFAKGLYFVNVLAENEVLGTARMIIE
jgi:bisphosphoglycerate-independent phosphoglycerate mutase (AlkP superfamily)